jgi:xylan 1,4-beta-xylosidase
MDKKQTHTSGFDPGRHRAVMQAIRPIMLGEWADICVKRDGDDYFLSQSSGRFRPGYPVWHSNDLLEWRFASYAASEFDGQVWTTDLVKDGGQWRALWLTDFGLQGNFEAHAATPFGPWSKPERTGFMGDTVIAIGPEGRRVAFHGARQATPLGEGFASAGRTVPVWHGEPIPAEFPIECFCLEAPKVLCRDGWWHLLGAQGGTFGPSTSHMIVSARSRDPLGPYENNPHNPIAHTASPEDPWWSIGHGELVEAPTGDWFCIFHGYPRHNRWIGRSTLIAPVEWTPGGWFRLGTEWPKDYDRPFSVDLPLGDDFRSPVLGPQWQTYGPMAPDRFKTGGGELVMTAPQQPFHSKGMHEVAVEEGRITPGTSGPLTIQPRDLAYEVTVEVEARGGARAGLGLFTRENEYVVELADSKGILRREQEKYRDYPSMRRSVETGSARVRLRIVQNQGDAAFYYRDGDAWKNLVNGVIATMNQPQPYPVRPALFCIGEGDAVFRDFTYRPLPLDYPGVAFWADARKGSDE